MGLHFGCTPIYVHEKRFCCYVFSPEFVTRVGDFYLLFDGWVRHSDVCVCLFRSRLSVSQEPEQAFMMKGNSGWRGSMRPGDWLCSGCGFHNYSMNGSCISCGFGRGQMQGGKGMYQNFGHAGDRASIQRELYSLLDQQSQVAQRIQTLQSRLSDFDGGEQRMMVFPVTGGHSPYEAMVPLSSLQQSDRRATAPGPARMVYQDSPHRRRKDKKKSKRSKRSRSRVSKRSKSEVSHRGTRARQFRRERSSSSSSRSSSEGSKKSNERDYWTRESKTESKKLRIVQPVKKQSEKSRSKSIPRLKPGAKKLPMNLSG